jgi:hypothetical protein
MVKLEIFKYLVEEYKKNGNGNGLKKWQYLYNNLNDYLLYKDQIDVLDYLIHVHLSPVFLNFNIWFNINIFKIIILVLINSKKLFFHLY